MDSGVRGDLRGGVSGSDVFRGYKMGISCMPFFVMSTLSRDEYVDRGGDGQ